jgi:hypothetical protein
LAALDSGAAIGGIRTPVVLTGQPRYNRELSGSEFSTLLNARWLMAVTVKSYPHYSISPEELAMWLETQPDCWWFVDGDPVLTGQVDFPCPSDELAEALRGIGKGLLMIDRTPDSQADGERIAPDELDTLADRDNQLRERTFLCCWEDADVDWLLIEDTEAAKHAR